MADSILETVKKALGLPVDPDPFDAEVVMYINSVFSTLNQLGIGPAAGFEIADDAATWDQFIGSDPRLNSVQTYVYFRVKLMFDPPTTSFAIKAIEDQIRELEFRLNVQREEETWTDPLATTES